MQQQSDLRIPCASAIIDRALDIRGSAARLKDDAAVRHIDTLIGAVTRGANFCWAMGVLIVASPSGGHYRVSQALCSCKNGLAGQHACWHWHAYQVLIDMWETEVETANSEADSAVRAAGRADAVAAAGPDADRSGARFCASTVAH